MKRYRIGVVGGDGIGPDVTREARKVLEAVEAAGHAGFDLQEFPYGADHYLETGDGLHIQNTTFMETWRRQSINTHQLQPFH